MARAHGGGGAERASTAVAAGAADRRRRHGCEPHQRRRRHPCLHRRGHGSEGGHGGGRHRRGRHGADEGPSLVQRGARLREKRGSLVACPHRSRSPLLSTNLCSLRVLLAPLPEARIPPPLRRTHRTASWNRHHPAHRSRRAALPRACILQRPLAMTRAVTYSSPCAPPRARGFPPLRAWVHCRRPRPSALVSTCRACRADATGAVTLGPEQARPAMLRQITHSGLSADESAGSMESTD